MTEDAARQNTAHSRGEIKALVLDDSSFDRQRIKRLASGLPMDIAFDEIASLDALDAVLDEERFDLIILDYNLPTGNGIEALKKIRAHVQNRNCPTIMLTGYDTSALAVQSIKSGCNDYISKDQLTGRTLVDCIVAALEQARVAREPQPGAALDKEELLAAVMRRYVEAIEPKVAKVVQDLRAAQHAEASDRSDLIHHLDGAEQQCLRIWSVLVDPRTVSSKGETLN